MGCSVNGSCSTFMSLARRKRTTKSGVEEEAEATNITEAAEEEASAYQLIFGDTSSSSSSRADNNANTLQASFLNVLTGSSASTSATITGNYNDDGIKYYLLGGGMSLVILVSLVVVLEKLRQRRVARDAPLLKT